MKQFEKFIAEARTTRASAQAKRMGLVGDGHGDWYDKQGTLKAKTVRGELKMYDARKAQKDADAADKTAAAQSDNAAKSTAKDQDQRPSAAARGVDVDALLRQVDQYRARQQFDQAARKEPLTVAFDKFDSDEIGDSVIAAAQESAAGGQFYIFPSRDADIERIKEAYGDAVIDDENAETIYDVLQSIYESGYNAINIVVRKSRATEIAQLATEQNGKLYNYVMMNVIPVEERSLEEQYKSGEIFNEGDPITAGDKSGKIIRRGPNYLICLDESKKIFRTWVKDATPAK